jgi:UrcA family protein
MLKLSLCLALSAATFSAAATAQEPATGHAANSARVFHADLNLASAAGRKTLDGRIRRAARGLCLDHRVAGVERAMAGRACMVKAIASAQPQIELAVRGVPAPAATRITLSLGR